MPKDFTVARLKFEELSPDAQAKAIENEQRALAESCPTELLEEVMLDTLGELLNGTGEAHTVPESVTILEWDITYRQGRGVHLGGQLNREQAPLLHKVWPESISHIEFKSSNFYGQSIDYFNEDGDYVDPNSQLTEAWAGIRREMLNTGTVAYEDFQSEENARAQLEGRDEEDAYIFLKDGSIDRVPGEKEDANV